MAEKEKEIPETKFLDEQTNDVPAKDWLPKQGSDLQDEGIKQKNDGINQNEPKSKTDWTSKINNHKFLQDNDEAKPKDEKDSATEELECEIVKKSFKMRVKMLNMQWNIVKTFISKELIQNEHETSNQMNDIKTCIDKVKPAIDADNFEQIENKLSIAEDLSTELMRKVNKVVKENAAQKEVEKRKCDIEIPDYRSTVTIRGTVEDVTDCIMKATSAFEDGKYDKAERLLLKAERMFPTKNARDLLEQIKDVIEGQKTDSLKLKKGDAPEMNNTYNNQEVGLKKNKDQMNEQNSIEIKSQNADMSTKQAQPSNVNGERKRNTKHTNKTANAGKLYDECVTNRTKDGIIDNLKKLVLKSKKYNLNANSQERHTQVVGTSQFPSVKTKSSKAKNSDGDFKRKKKPNKKEDFFSNIFQYRKTTKSGNEENASRDPNGNEK